jgi:hypothetical protein
MAMADQVMITTWARETFLFNLTRTPCIRPTIVRPLRTRTLGTDASVPDCPDMSRRRYDKTHLTVCPLASRWPRSVVPHPSSPRTAGAHDFPGRVTDRRVALRLQPAARLCFRHGVPRRSYRSERGSSSCPSTRPGVPRGDKHCVRRSGIADQIGRSNSLP